MTGAESFLQVTPSSTLPTSARRGGESGYTMDYALPTPTSSTPKTARSYRILRPRFPRMKSAGAVSTPPHSPMDIGGRGSVDTRPTSGNCELFVDTLFKGWLHETGFPLAHFVAIHTDHEPFDMEWLVGSDAGRRRNELVGTAEDGDELGVEWSFKENFTNCVLGRIRVPKDYSNIENLTIACPEEWQDPKYSPHHLIFLVTARCLPVMEKLLDLPEWSEIRSAISRVYLLQEKPKELDRLLVLGPSKDRRPAVKEKLPPRAGIKEIVLGSSKHTASRVQESTKPLVKEIKHLLKGYRLLEATRRGPLDMVEALRLDQGVNLDLGVRNKDNENVYHLVARRACEDPVVGYELMKRFLLWDPNPRNLQMGNISNDTPLHIAIRENAPISIISLLVHNGASDCIDRANNNHETPRSIVARLEETTQAEDTPNSPEDAFKSDDASILPKSEDKRGAEDASTRRRKIQELFERSGETIVLDPVNSSSTVWEDVKPPHNAFAVEATKLLEVTTAEFSYSPDNRSTCMLESHTVYDYIYNNDAGFQSQASLSRSSSETTCKWIHLPANNPQWINDLFLKLGIQDQQFDHQKHEAKKPYGRFIPPYAGKWKAVTKEDPPSSTLESSQSDFRIFMPFLNFEPNHLRVAAGAIIRGVSSSKPAHLNMMRDPTDLIDCIAQADDDLKWKWPQWKSETRIKYKQADIEGSELKHERALIAGYLHNDPMQLHPRRTLDQFYYHMLGEEELERRDQDQVIFRWMSELQEASAQEEVLRSKSAQGKSRRSSRKMPDPKVLMVDQLWLWVVDEKTVITCFPKPWSNQHPSADVVKRLKYYFRSKDREPIASVYDLVVLILQFCTDILVKANAERGTAFIDYFEASIADATQKESRMLEMFSQHLYTLGKNKGPGPSTRKHDVAKDIWEFLDICKETELLRQVKDIQDEIQMIKKLLKMQHGIIQRMLTTDIFRLAHKSLDLDDGELEPHVSRTSQKRKSSSSSQIVVQNTKQRYLHQLKAIDVLLDDFQRMDEQSKNVNEGINSLLDSKQKHANAWEAHSSRLQADAAAKQGDAILMFTIVTIIFLPLSFLASFFTIDISQFPQNDLGRTEWDLHTCLRYILGISCGVSIPLILLALNAHRVRRFFSDLGRSKMMHSLMNYRNDSDEDFNGHLPRYKAQRSAIMMSTTTEDFRSDIDSEHPSVDYRIQERRNSNLGRVRRLLEKERR
ncbi:hypothetical protein BJ508DRAFT_412163 [Ascobolus immersus RN42]|uniref:Uncharacterized protein n=1 Tax=Ascobolus immersus RN42 TaxID=1160509 RepID=A0A3N4IGW4_ASCIM|nr:hypothetical protein BJ508DRAFT_412163 [Ascobolus immersus RN42]